MDLEKYKNDPSLFVPLASQHYRKGINCLGQIKVYFTDTIAKPYYRAFTTLGLCTYGRNNYCKIQNLMSEAFFNNEKIVPIDKNPFNITLSNFRLMTEEEKARKKSNSSEKFQ